MPSLSHSNYSQFVKYVFLLFFRGFFEMFPMPEFAYNSDDSKSKLIISDKLSYALTQIEKKPIIVVDRGSMRWGNTTNNQMLTTSIAPRNNISTYTDLIYGSLTIRCMSREIVEAERLATVVFQSVKIFKQNLRDMGLHEIMDVVLGGAQVVDGKVEPVASEVPVQISFCFQDTWSIEPRFPDQAKKLQKIILKYQDLYKNPDGYINPDEPVGPMAPIKPDIKCD